LSTVVDEFDTGVVFGRGASNVVRRVDRDAVDEPEPEAVKFGEGALGQIRYADHGNAPEASLPASKNCLVRLSVESNGRGAPKIGGIADSDDRAECVGRHV